ncbi:hypothetical protein GMOD_00009236 [Pyrenophora seminiperda CCB06]|uniref:Uncharacterized protein n=1 Tax=Pyrenophora seminiperda CCB06 TaxID=1302712 RepID=A0A3M7MBJ0_9PLEO|nr:hypothetical protein GMOD_00009236 [Pyrenophora seminiperda CCB06]
MAFLDIDDFNTRSAVAQLMVVAPALLIRDLYHLIINNKGRFSEAKERAIRMNMDTCRENKPPLRPQQLHEHESDENDILIKVDYNDPAFDWDTDEPEPEPIATTRSRLSKLGPKRKTTTSTNQHHASKKKKLIKSGKTSSDYGFFVEDNVMHYDFTADDSTESSGVDSQMSKNSDAEMSDGDDKFDLNIDMQPRYAYNAHLLGTGRSPTKR